MEKQKPKIQEQQAETNEVKADNDDLLKAQSDELLIIQQKLNAPKGQYNSFGKYKYRSCEDILAAVKPLLKETSSTLTLSDEITSCLNRVYIKATATLRTSSGKEYSTVAFAREDEVKKGMDGAQITGSASSYARKYALNGLFSIDDTKDPDATNTHGQEQNGPAESGKGSSDASRGTTALAFTGEQLKEALSDLGKCQTEQQVQDLWVAYASSIPALCKNGTEFYNAVALKLQHIKTGR